MPGHPKLVTCTAAVCALAGLPLSAAAAPAHHVIARAASGSASGVVYGGLTAQHFPVVIEMSKNGRRVAQAYIAIHLSCATGGGLTAPDNYSGLALSKKRKFQVSFGPAVERNDDGTTTDFEGSASGTLNKARTKVTGTWSLKMTERDATGAVTDTCDSGPVSWTAKQ